MVVNRRWIEVRWRLAASALAIAMIGYFAWHAVYGASGILAREQLTQRVAELQRELAVVADERKAMERRVALLKAQSLDPDILEESARAALGLAHPNDVVILHGGRTAGQQHGR